MSNVDSPFGFRPVRHLKGSRIITEPKVLTVSKTIYPGEVMKIVADGTVEIAAADDGAICCGVASEYVVSPATGITYIAIWYDPDLIYKVQSTTGVTAAATDVGATANHVATAGNSTYKQSRQELDAVSGAQFRVLRLHPTDDNAWGEHAIVEVVFNEHTEKAAVAGV